MESTPQSSYPGKLLDLAVDEKIISEIQHKQMWKDNVLRWLGADHDESLKERLKIK